MAVVEARNMRFKYDEAWVLKDLTFTSCEGEFLGIIGPNGSGKTTLVKLIDGLLTPRQGAVHIDGTDIRTIKRSEIARQIAVVPQDIPMIFAFTVQEVILMGRSPHLGRLRFEDTRDFEIVERAMEMTGVLPFAARSINELSGGERQRVLIARALAQEPDIILLDESTAFLDIKHQVAFFELMKRLNKDEGMTVIAVTHDINLAASFCDRIMLLKGGAIHSMGPPDDVVTESNITEVYDTQVLVDRNPATGLPRVTLLASQPTD